MSGLVKAKKYDWKDSNLALFGSDTEKQVKKESAETEPAWTGVGQEVGLKIWRIVKFQVKDWPEDDYGKFYTGDSYIILNTYKEEEELKYDVHFWIGKYSTQDEYGTAAYKTVELDTLLDDKAIQHREVQGHESNLFKSYFTTIEYLKGGADTGFRHVTPTEYKPRLLQFCGARKYIQITEVRFSKSSINPDDVFILDLGLELYQIVGEGANKDEKFKATQHCMKIKSERGGKPKSEVVDPDSHYVTKAFDENPEEDADDDDDDETDYQAIKQLYRIACDNGGTVELVKGSDASTDDLSEDDVFLLDRGDHVYIWVGKGASPSEKKNGLPYAQRYLSGTDHPCASVSVINSGKESEDFRTAMAA